jgi:hypothetical protein
MPQGGEVGGSPLPLLFNIATNVLTRMVISAQQNDLITRMVAHLIPKGIASLQHVDDMIMCLEDDMEKARNLKIFLYMFEQMSGRSILRKVNLCWW